MLVVWFCRQMPSITVHVGLWRLGASEGMECEQERSCHLELLVSGARRVSDEAYRLHAVLLLINATNVVSGTLPAVVLGISGCA